MQAVETVSDTRFIATQKLVASDTHMDLPEVLFHARDDGLTSHADIPPAIVPFDEVDVIRRCLRFQSEREGVSICFFCLIPVVNPLKVFGIQTLQNRFQLVAPGDDVINQLISVHRYFPFP